MTYRFVSRAVSLVLGVLLISSCSTSEGNSLPNTSESPPSTGTTSAPESGSVTVYDPERSWNGFTLAFLNQRIPIVMDMNGRVVHRWPEARVKSRVRLLEDGSLLAVALGRGIVEYDWDGNLAWEWVADFGFAHHDVIRSTRGTTITLIRPDGDGFDHILEVDRSGDVVWQWHGRDHLLSFVPPPQLTENDITHLNSVQELPENPWSDQGDVRFRPGNLLVSARELDLIFIIDKETQEVVWTYDTHLQKQHEAQMVEPGLPGAGRIWIYNNRYRSFYRDRQSAIQLIDPISQRLVWQYRSAGFLSPTSGVQQHLPNGNVLITSTRGGRTFEVTQAGRLVWEWAPPFDPMRSRRYSYDHCPQLAAISRGSESPVEPADGYRYIDKDVYRFARRGLLRKVQVDGIRRRGVLRHNNDCRQLVLPLGAKAILEYGVDRQAALEAGHRDYAAIFRLSLRPVGGDQKTVLHSDRVSLDDQSWQTQTIDLSGFELRHVDFCIETEQLGLPASATGPELAFWRRPAIRPARAMAVEDEANEPPSDNLTDEELEIQKRHLEALGYIN